MRLGIFGGSFDPVHCGHLLLAECCREQAVLDEVWFVPAAHQPLKPRGPKASNVDRLAMLQRACVDEKSFRVSEIELNRGGVSYTVDTLAAIHAEQPAAELFFLMGADSLADLPNWHRPEEICRLATPLVVDRPGNDVPNFDALGNLVSPERLAAIRQQLVQMEPTPISSSQIRELIGSQGDWKKLVPVAVAEYICQQQLYS